MSTMYPCAVLIFGIVLHLTSAANILVVPFPTRSHSLVLMRLSEEINKQYGHKSTFILPGFLMNSSFITNFDHIYVEANKFDNKKLETIEQDIFDSAIGADNMVWIKLLFTEVTKLSEQILTDKELFGEIKTTKYDLAIIDNFFNSPCISILAYRLSIPYIHVGRVVDPVGSRIPISLSSMPATVFFQFSIPMTLLDRLKNTLIYHFLSSVPDIFNPKGAVAKYAPEKPPLDMSDMRAHVQLHLLDYDVLLDWPLPLPPNFIAIGGLNTKKPDPLKGKLAKFMDQATKGAIIISFGGAAARFPQSLLEKLKLTFKQLGDIAFVVKIQNYVFEEENVYSLPWMSQNDLLGHKNTKAFVTHCGNGGQFEALYNAIPMIGLPFCGDQHYNARRMEIKGYGIQLDISTFTSTDLINAIKEVTENRKYKQKIKLASEIFKHRPQTPIQRAVFWVEHVIRYGGHHMRTYSHDIPYYQYILLDVYAVILMVLTAMFVTSYAVIKNICNCCHRGRKKKTE